VLIVAIFYAGLLIAPWVRSVMDRVERALDERPVVRSMITATWFALTIVGIVIFDREARAFVYFQF
jgi:hypothetical protein